MLWTVSAYKWGISMKEKAIVFLKTKEYCELRSRFMKSMGVFALVDENLCDTFLLDCINGILFDPAIKKDEMNNTPEKSYYEKWSYWVGQIASSELPSLADVIEQLEGVIEPMGKHVSERLQESTKEEEREQVVRSIAKVFIAIVEFCFALRLDPVEILLQSTYGCELEEYGATVHLVDNVIYRIDTSASGWLTYSENGECKKLDSSCKAHTFLHLLNKKTPELYKEFLGAMYEIWGTFNIFHAKKDVCSAIVFEKELKKIIAELATTRQIKT